VKEEEEEEEGTAGRSGGGGGGEEEEEEEEERNDEEDHEDGESAAPLRGEARRAVASSRRKGARPGWERDARSSRIGSSRPREFLASSRVSAARADGTISPFLSTGTLTVINQRPVIY